MNLSYTKPKKGKHGMVMVTECNDEEFWALLHELRVTIDFLKTIELNDKVRKIE